MRLTTEQLSSLALGTVGIEQKDDGVHFYKCTARQIAAFDALHKDLGYRAETTTGVRLDFFTDADSLAFAVSAGNKYELYIDDVLRQQFLLGNCSGQRVEVTLNDPLEDKKAEYRITLCFPSHEIGVLSYLELPDGAHFRPCTHACKLLMIGDSITQGWDSKYDTFSYAWRVTRHFDADSIIQGIGGAFFHESTFDDLPFDPDAVTIAFGTNDFGHYKTLDLLRQHAAAHLSCLTKAYPDKPIFVITPIWRSHREGHAMGSFEECRAVITEEAEKLGLHVVDGLTLVPPFPEFFADGWLHPNDEGFSHFAENLCREMEKYI